MKLYISGTVQGVGFRPTVHRIATGLGIRGYVLNRGSDVEIGIVDDAKSDVFLAMLKKQIPPLAAIEHVERSHEPVTGYDSFSIIRSTSGEKNSLTPVDTALCDACARELFDPGNRRYLYPFTNCTSCGARFSVTEDVPYDRAQTAMRDFSMCTACTQEYKTGSDRRFHAQTISCPSCGPDYALYTQYKERVATDDAIREFAGFIDGGAPGVIKGWGGMHLVCTFDAIPQLRERYNRPAKPFAVMFRDSAAARRFVTASDEEEALLRTPSRPIVLLEKRRDDAVSECISPGLGTIGTYLPYAGLHHVLFHHLKADGIVMTSANLSGDAMIVDNDEAFSLPASYFLLHNRRIVNRIDDSVVRYWHGRTFFIRRSRGYIPAAFAVPHAKTIVALGAGENVTLGISKRGRFYPSQYIGDSASYSAMTFLEETRERMMALHAIAPTDVDAIAVDLHPRYGTTVHGKKLAAEWDCDLVGIQHHWAHAASLLFDTGVDESIILTLDGTGYGTDGTAWGGEVLRASYTSFDRVASLQTLPLIGSDMAVREPRRVVFAMLSALGRDDEAARFVSEAEYPVMKALLAKAPVTSSFGRVLDAVAHYLGICDRMTYDGEPAMRLERYLARGSRAYPFENPRRGATIETQALFNQFVDYARPELTEKNKADLAHSFVAALVDGLIDAAADAAEQQQIASIGITGGVSYDVPIVALARDAATKRGLTFLTHKKIPNGDGGIAVGQNLIAGHTIRQRDTHA